MEFVGKQINKKFDRGHAGPEILADIHVDILNKRTAMRA